MTSEIAIYLSKREDNKLLKYTGRVKQGFFFVCTVSYYKKETVLFVKNVAQSRVWKDRYLNMPSILKSMKYVFLTEIVLNFSFHSVEKEFCKLM